MFNFLEIKKPSFQRLIISLSQFHSLLIKLLILIYIATKIIIILVSSKKTFGRTNPTRLLLNPQEMCPLYSGDYLAIIWITIPWEARYYLPHVLPQTEEQFLHL